MLGKFIHRLEALRKRQSNSELTPVDRFWESELPTIMLEQEIGHPTPHEPTVLPLLTPIPQPVRAASPVVGPDGLTAKQRHEARLKAFREADQQRAAARQELARRLGAGDAMTNDELRREDIEPRLRGRDLGISL